MLPGASTAEPPADETAQILDAQDGVTLRMQDGKLLRLAGIAVPNTQRQAAQAMLHDNASEKTVRLAVDPAQRFDRYGRMLAQVYAPGTQDRTLWLQEKLLAEGLAYVDPLTADASVAPLLLAAEKTARTAKTGLWQAPEFQPVPAENADARIGAYALIKGTVRNAARRGDKIYLNFGADWRSDFTVMIERKDWKNFRDPDPLALQGRSLIVRGVLHRDNGPMLRVTRAAQIEVLPGSPGDGDALREIKEVP